MRILLLPALLALPAPALATPEWRQARDYEVRLSNFNFAPATIRLRAGEPVRLRLVNISPTTHSFDADTFFARAQRPAGDDSAVQSGKVIVPGNDVREVVLVPAPGRYRARSGNFVTRLLGMSSAIIVE